MFRTLEYYKRVKIVSVIIIMTFLQYVPVMPTIIMHDNLQGF